MRDDTARALAILIGTDDQVRRLQIAETGSGYCFPPVDIARFFGEETVKKFWGCPDDYSKLQKWARKCDFLVEKIRKEDNLMYELNSLASTQSVHDWDWKVRLNRSKLDFSYDRYAEKPAEKAIQELDNKKEPIPAGDFNKRNIWGKL